MPTRARKQTTNAKEEEEEEEEAEEEEEEKKAGLGEEGEVRVRYAEKRVTGDHEKEEE